MSDLSIYKVYKGEADNPFPYENPDTYFEHDIWIIEHYFESFFLRYEGCDWFQLLGKDFINLLPGEAFGAEEDYQLCKDRIKKDMLHLFWVYMYTETEKINKAFYDKYLAYQK